MSMVFDLACLVRAAGLNHGGVACGIEFMADLECQRPVCGLSVPLAHRCSRWRLSLDLGDEDRERIDLTSVKFGGRGLVLVMDRVLETNKTNAGVPKGQTAAV